ncbi:hypothetical protein ACM7V5_04795 [Pseudomonas aeruginosa]
MRKHTPGPWHVGGPNKCTIYDKHGQRLANSFEGVMATQRTDSECEANARLIAAAPELLDALVNLLPLISPLKAESQQVANASAAIAKSTA